MGKSFKGPRSANDNRLDHFINSLNTKYTNPAKRGPGRTKTVENSGSKSRPRPKSAPAQREVELIHGDIKEHDEGLLSHAGIKFVVEKEERRKKAQTLEARLENVGSKAEERRNERARQAWAEAQIASKSKAEKIKKIQEAAEIKNVKCIKSTHKDRTSTKFRGAHDNGSMMQQIVQNADKLHTDLGIEIMHGTLGPEEDLLIYPPKQALKPNAKKQKARANDLAQPRHMQESRRGKSNPKQKLQKTRGPATPLEWTMWRAAKSPGPGAYDVGYDWTHSSGNGPYVSLNLSTGRVNEIRPQTDVHSPGPGEYHVPSALGHTSSSNFGLGHTSPAEWQEYHKEKNALETQNIAENPGPGQYTQADYVPPGGRFAKGADGFYRFTNKPPVATSEIGPGEYPIVRSENWDRIPSFKICASERTTLASRNETKEKLYKSPAPGDYSIKFDPRLTLPHGGKFANPNGHKNPDGAFDRTIIEAQAMPGPGEYSVPSTLNTRGGRFSTAHTGTFILDLKEVDPAQEEFDWRDWENLDDSQPVNHFGSVKDLLKARKAGEKTREREHREWKKEREVSSQAVCPITKNGTSADTNSLKNAKVHDNNISHAEGSSPTKHFGSVKDLLEARKEGEGARQRELRDWQKERDANQ